MATHFLLLVDGWRPVSTTYPMKTYAETLAFAAKKHAGHMRRDGSNYIIHPIRVSQEVKTPIQKIIALLHDTLEDTETTYMEILEEFGPEVVQAVEALTKRKDEPYMDYILRVKQNPDAVAVKIADIADNLSDAPSDKQIRKSSEAITFLTFEPPLGQ